MIEWVAQTVEHGGYAAIALLMFIENLVPPIPSELIMPLAGFTAARGELHPVLVILAGSAGSLAGSTLWYALGRGLGSERLKRFAARRGRWLTLTPKEIDRACAWFDRHGWLAVLAGRMVPAVRTLISVPAGVAAMPVGVFLAASAVGTLAWTTLLTGAGYLLESRYEEVARWIDPMSHLAVAALVVLYLWRVVTFRRRVPRS